MTKSAKPTATERSEGGSKRRRPAAEFTEQVVARISKAQLMMLEEHMAEHRCTLGRAIRDYLDAGSRFLAAAPAELTREPFEDAP